MKKQGMKYLYTGMAGMVAFTLWTWLIRVVDVRIAGESHTPVGFATVNCRFHDLTGVHMGLYTVTDWLGLVPVFGCLLMGTVGLVQLIHRKKLRKVDMDILLLGMYYVLVMGAYLLFEYIPVNYRPILIDGRQEASYPFSTTLLVLSVMPTLVFQARRRIRNLRLQPWLIRLVMAFSLFMVLGRLISGVHWLTDIVGSVLLSIGLFRCYQAAVLLTDDKHP